MRLKEGLIRQLVESLAERAKALIYHSGITFRSSISLVIPIAEKKPVASLYKICGEDGPVKQRIQKEMQWLTSSEEHGINRHLRKAYQNHWKPLEIEPNLNNADEYDPLEHRVYINPCSKSLDFITANGTIFRPSPSVLLAHEITHAQQRLKPFSYTNAMTKTQTAVLRTILSNPLTQKLLDNAQQELNYARHTPFFGKATAHLEKLVRLTRKTELLGNELKATHPEYKKHILPIEREAVQTENHIAALRGEPQRAHYLATAPNQQETLLELENELELDKKVPFKSEQLGKWQRAIKNRKNLTFSEWKGHPQEHDLIARLKPGGRT